MNSRRISILIAVASVVFYSCMMGWEGFVYVSGYLAIPICCIWFPDEMGSYTGGVGRGHITRPTPGKVIFFLGWVFLMIPFLGLVSFFIELCID